MTEPAPITAVIPRPRPVRLGGRTFLASELRLDDVADLQAWIEAETADADPFEAAAPDLLSGERGRAWKLLLWRTIHGVEVYPPRIGTGAADALIDTPAGTARQLWLSLRREHPALAEAEAAALLAEATAGQWGRFCRLAWGVRPMAVTRRLIDGDDDQDAGPTEWSALWLAYIAKAGPGAPPFGSLTLTQLRTWLADGDLDDGADRGSSDSDIVAVMAKARKRAAFWEEIRDEIGDEW